MSDKNEAYDALKSAIDSIRHGLGRHGKGTDYDPSQIKRARKALGMSREKFARWVGGFSASTVGRWERGENCPGREAKSSMKYKLRTMFDENDREKIMPGDYYTVQGGNDGTE